LIDRTPSVRIVFYTDVHARPGRDIAPALQAMGVALGAQRADVIIAGGDSVDAGMSVSAEEARSMWISYRSILATVGGDVRHVFGERDLAQAGRGGADPRALIREELHQSRTYGAFNAEEFHFVLLDSVEITKDKAGYRGFVGKEQLDWLAADVAAVPSTQPVIAVTHMPLRTTAFDQRGPGDGPPDQIVVNAKEVLDVLMRRQLVLVLQGHVGKAEAFKEAGVTFLTGGAVCGHWCKHDHPGTTPGFVVAKVRPDRVQWQYGGYGA
jgi:hypothetical protein